MYRIPVVLIHNILHVCIRLLTNSNKLLLNLKMNIFCTQLVWIFIMNIYNIVRC